MNGPALVMFGGSPFIEKVDVPNLLHNYLTLGLNKFSVSYPTDYGFMYDEFIPGSQAAELWLPKWFKEDGRKYAPKPSPKPFIPKKVDEKKRPVLGIKGYTSTLAANWAAIAGFKSVYLVGIDHNETDTYFVHFDKYGEDTPAELTPESHRKVKAYFSMCAKLSGVQFYQTNPDAKGWDLPYIDIEALYGPQES